MNTILTNFFASMEPVMILVALISFGLHLYGKWMSRTEPVKFWAWVKANAHYIGYAVALGSLASLMHTELMDVLGFTKPLTYTFFVWYGGAHGVSQALGIKAAGEQRKAEKRG